MLKGTLIPKYMNDFQCIGGACEDTCCSGWMITIDKKTYKKYQKIKEPKLKSNIQENVKRIKKNNMKSEELYARFLMGQNGCCSMLTDDKWCQIQKELGEEHLSVTCTSYPRNLNKVDGIYELSARVSCPEVARLALLEPNGIEFDELDFDINPIWPVYKNQDSESSTRIRQLFWPIRMLAIEILQTRRIQLGDRMVIMGMFVNSMQANINEKNGVDLERIIDTYRENLTDSEYLASVKGLKTNLDMQLQVLFELIKYRTELGIDSSRYLITREEMLEGLGQQGDESNFELFKRNYEMNFSEFYSPYMKSTEYILENYTVNLFFNLLFPNTDGSNNSLFDEYVTIAMLYALLKVHLVGIAGKHQGLDDELVIRTIQSYAKAMEHNNFYIKSILENLKSNNYYSLAHATILVKDLSI